MKITKSLALLLALVLIGVGQADSRSNIVCRLPKIVGKCRAAKPRYYFNTETGMCSMFLYGGCGGNENNFQTLDQCLKSCVPPRQMVCGLGPVTGPCRAAKEKYFFNARTGQCEVFTYGGCQGNGNRFNTHRACWKRCGSMVTLH